MRSTRNTRGYHERREFRHIALSSLPSLFLLFLLAAFMVVTAAAAIRMTIETEQMVKLRVQLADRADITGLQQAIGRLPGVKRMQYSSKEQNLKDLADYLGEPELVTEYAGADNPLPAELTVELTDADSALMLGEQIKTLPGVTEVILPEDVGTILEQAKLVRMILAGLILVTLIALLNTTRQMLRLLINRRQHEIRLMDELGTPAWRIWLPAALEGWLMTVPTALLAWTLAWQIGTRILLHSAATPGFVKLAVRQSTTVLGVGLPLAALLMAAVAAKNAVTPYVDTWRQKGERRRVADLLDEADEAAGV